VLDENPNDTKRQTDLAVTIWIQGFASHKAGRFIEALARWQEARGLAERAIEVEPGTHRGLGALAMILNDLGEVLFRMDRTDEAADCFTEAVRRFDAALALAPAEDEYRRGRGLALVNTAVVLHRRDRPAVAVRAMQEPLTVFSDLGRRYRGYFKYQNELASVQARIGGWRLGLNQPKEALEALQAAWDLREEIASKNANAPGVWTDLAGIANEVGRAQWQSGNVSEAVRAFRRACDAGQRAVEMAGPTPASLRRLAADLLNLSAAHFAARQPKEALDATDRAIQLWEVLIKDESPPNLENLYHLAGALNNRGLALNDLKRYDEALPTFDEATRRFREVLDKSGPKEARWQLSSVYHGIASAHRGLGRPADAAKAARECRKNLPDDPNDLFDVARQFAMCADLVGKGKPDLTANDRAERRTYADEAMAALRHAVKSGFKDAGRLEKDGKLESLHGRDDFQALVKELEGKTTPKKGP